MSPSKVVCCSTPHTRTISSAGNASARNRTPLRPSGLPCRARRLPAATLPHIPPARVQLIRRYGLYSSRSKGHWTRMPYVLQRAPSGWTSQDDDTAATASNRARSSEVPATETDAPDARERRHAWARLLARVYEVDPLVCPRCGARLRVIAVIQNPVQIIKILNHLVRTGRAPPRLDPTTLD